LVRFAVTPPPKTVRAPHGEGFPAQLALAQIHPRLVPVQPVPGGFALDPELTRDWFELAAQRGFAGYGLARALRILLDVLNGLIALHDTKTEAGTPFVHGEVVPALLRVDRQGVGRLVPLAAWHRFKGGAPPARERQGHLAPERLLGDAIDQRADVFSCGVLLWEALAGRRLFETDSVDSIVTRLMGGKLQLPALPPELAWAMPLKAVAMCALSVDPAQRFADCAELAAAIEDVARSQVATHEDVALYFGAREHGSQPPLAALIMPPSHNSSLSALVSPAAPRAEPALQPLPAPVSEHTPSSVARRLWTAGALLSLLAALGVSVFARYNGALSGSPLAAPAKGLVAPAPPSVAASAPAASGAPAAPDSQNASGQPAVMPTGSYSGKARSSGPASKPAVGAPHVHSVTTVAKPAPARDKTADAYGI
jgi:serine/threonine-protein kinase